jgi:hypothetical protein
VNGTAWAFYHLNQQIKSVIGSILPLAVCASYARESTGNIYWTSTGHYLSNAYGAWSSGQQQPADSTGAGSALARADTPVGYDEPLRGHDNGMLMLDVATCVARSQ